jgi:hypothetical protein
MGWFRKRKGPDPLIDYTVRPTRDYARLVADLDLSLVKQKAAGRHRWRDEQANAAEADYRRFLYLMATNPTQPIVPWTQDLDNLWHEHILDTKRYAEDCQRIFGRFIHHDPHIGRSPALEAQARRATGQLYDRAFFSSATLNQSDSSLAWMLPATMLMMNSPAHAEHDGSHGGGPGDGWLGGSTHDASAPAASCSSAPASSCSGGASCGGGGGGGCGGGGGG